MREMVLSREQIDKICQSIGKKLTKRLENNDKAPVFIGVMKGALNFMMDLIKCCDISMILDFIQISSYNGTSTTGKIILKKEVSMDIKGRTVVIIEDIIDTGISMKYLVEHMKKDLGASEVIVVALFDKACARKIDVQIDYSGIVLKESKYLVGYGLDYNEYERNTPYVFVPDEEDFRTWDNLNKK